MEGFIKLHRKTLESPIWTDPELFRLWTYCLLKASYKDRKVIIERNEVELKAGEFITGRFSLHQDFNNGVPPRKRVKEITLWSWLKKLENMGNINIKTTNKYSVVSVVNWCEYQETLTTEQQQNNNKVTTEQQQNNTNKNLKNLEKVKKRYLDYVLLTDDEYQRLINDYSKQTVDSKIEDLDNYIGSKGKKYKDHNKTLRMWLKKDTKKQNNTFDDLFERLGDE